MDWFDTTKYILSFIIGLYAWWKIIFKDPLNKASRINGIIYLALASMLASAPDLISLLYFIISFFLISTLSTLLARIFIPIDMLFAKRNSSYKVLGIIKGIEYGILSCLLFLLFIYVIDFDDERLLILLVILSALLNNIQRVIMKDGQEKKYEYYVLVPELLILIIFSISLIC